MGASAKYSCTMLHCLFFFGLETVAGLWSHCSLDWGSKKCSWLNGKGIAEMEVIVIRWYSLHIVPISAARASQGTLFTLSGFEMCESSWCVKSWHGFRWFQIIFWWFLIEVVVLIGTLLDILARWTESERSSAQLVVDVARVWPRSRLAFRMFKTSMESAPFFAEEWLRLVKKFGIVCCTTYFLILLHVQIHLDESGWVKRLRIRRIMIRLCLSRCNMQLNLIQFLTDSKISNAV
jgi:hypothetical protein